VHHSGVEILGTEYTFASGAGIFDHSPREAPGAKFRERYDYELRLLFVWTTHDDNIIVTIINTYLITI
jgi:hypothetical protein